MNLTISVAVTDDHPIFRQGMISRLRNYPQICVQFESANGKELLEKLLLNSVDIVLLDLEMPGMNGVDALGRVCKEFPQTKVIILSNYFGPAYICRMIEDGAVSYVSKCAPVREIVHAIEKVREHGFYYSEQVITAFIAYELHRERRVTIHKPVSEKEMEVLRHLRDNKTNEEIAELMEICVRTVEGHRMHLLQKTGATNFAAVLAYAQVHSFAL
jgi:two-component system, NarL family, response regulator DegU